MDMGVLPTRSSVYHMHACCLQSERDIKSPGTEIANGWKLPWGVGLRIEPGSLGEQPVLLTAQPSLQTFDVLIIKNWFSSEAW